MGYLKQYSMAVVVVWHIWRDSRALTSCMSSLGHAQLASIAWNTFSASNRGTQALNSDINTTQTKPFIIFYSGYSLRIRFPNKQTKKNSNAQVNEPKYEKCLGFLWSKMRIFNAALLHKNRRVLYFDHLLHQ